MPPQRPVFLTYREKELRGFFMTNLLKVSKIQHPTSN